MLSVLLDDGFWVFLPLVILVGGFISKVNWVCNFDPQKSVVRFWPEVEGKVPSMWKLYLLICPNSLDWLAFLLSLLVVCPINPCISMMSSQSPSLEVKYLIFWLGVYSLIYTIGMVWFPLFSRWFMSSARSYRNGVIGNSILIRLEKCVRYWAYNEPSPLPDYGGTGM